MDIRHLIYKNIEQVHSGGAISDPYPGGTWFESWLGPQLTEPKSFMVFFSPLK